MSNTECTCGRCPEIRATRGLLPFCRMPAPAPRDRSGEFGSYSEAAAAKQPGQRIKSATRPGGPKTFVLVPG